MKKILLLLAAFFSLLAKGYSEPVSNPVIPSLLEEGLLIPDTSWVNLRLTAETRYTNSLNLRAAGSAKDLAVRKPQLSGWLSSGGITLNIRERGDIYAAFGGGRMEFTFQNQGYLFKGKSQSGFYWAVGSKVSLIEIKRLTIGVDVNYQHQSADGLYFLRNEITQVQQDPTFSMHEFQINVAASYLYDIFSPYFGVSYNNVKLSLDPFTLQNLNRLRFKSDNLVGIFVGTSLSNRSIFFLNCEIRLLNEMSYLLSGDVRF